MKEIIMGELVTLNGRIYIVEDSPFSNGKKQGRRAILRLLSREEMEQMLLEEFKKHENS